jgi:hypothetical protein
VVRFREGGVPDHLKTAAARGALPLPPEDLLEVLFVLRTEHDKALQQAIVATVGAMPEDPLTALARDPATSPVMLDFLVRAAFRREPVVEGVLLNPAVGDATLKLVAEHGGASLLELLALNQVRLARCPAVMEAMLRNAHATPSMRRRLHEVQELHARDVARRPARPALPVVPAPPAPEPQDAAGPRPAVQAAGGTPVAAPVPEAAPAEPAPQAAVVAAPEELDLDALEGLEELGALGAVEEAILQAMREDDASEEELRLAQRLLTMTVPAKVQLALKGNREARMVLIRDASKQVQESVLKSPKITENEIEQISKMRSIGEDLLRYIGHNREMTKNYTIVHNLVRNPKCPQPVAVQLMQRLQTRDLGMLVKDKNIPDVVRRHARVTLEKRQPKKVQLKKK